VRCGAYVDCSSRSLLTCHTDSARVGTLPATICEAAHVNVISLDGLTSAESCTKRLWDPLHYFQSGYFATSMRGTYHDTDVCGGVC
jgi:hypothetical protein